MPFPPTPAGVHSGTNMRVSRKGQWRREHPAHGPPGRSSLETRDVYFLCETATQGGDSHPRIHQYIDICTVPNYTSLGGRKIKVRIMGWSDFQTLHVMRLILYPCHKSPVRDSSLDQGMHCTRWTSPPLLTIHQGETLSARGSRSHRPRGGML